MAWVEVIPEDRAEGLLAKMYRDAKQRADALGLIGPDAHARCRDVAGKTDAGTAVRAHPRKPGVFHDAHGIPARLASYPPGAQRIEREDQLIGGYAHGLLL